MALGGQPFDQPQQAAPAVGTPVRLGQRHRERPARRGEQPVEHLELALGAGRVEIGDELDHARARVLHAERDAQQFRLRRAQRRRRVALHRAMVERARGREAERPVAHRLRRQHAHLRNLVRRRLLEPGRALAHHEDAQRAVRQLGAEIHVARLGGQRIEILAERFPRPVEALVERGAGNILDAFHQLDQALAVLALHRREAHAAVAHHGRRDAVPARGLEIGIPGRLAVIVGVDVDEARRDQQPLGRDLFPARAGDLADGRDPTVLHRDVGLARAAARAVGDRAAANDQIEVRHVFAPDFAGV